MAVVFFEMLVRADAMICHRTFNAGTLHQYIPALEDQICSGMNAVLIWILMDNLEAMRGTEGLRIYHFTRLQVC